MGPTPGACFDFQFGKCNQPNHHETPNGEFLLHICQPCYQIRQLLVHHSCAGRHPGHHGGERRVGAVGCHSQLSQVSPQAQPPTTSVSTSSHIVQSTASPSVQNSIPTQQPNSQNQVGAPCAQCKSCGDRTDTCRCETYRHTPDPLCSCSDCSRFVRQYSYNLEKLCKLAGVPEFDLYSTFYDYHSEDADEDENDNSDVNNYTDNWDSVSTISSTASSIASSTTFWNESFSNSFQNPHQSFYSDFYH